MGILAWLHYTFRAVLLLFGRLRSFRLVKVQSAIVCLHVVEIRVIFDSRRPSHYRLFAIVTRVRTPSTFIAAMKPSAVARCATANELLRRRKQTVCDNTTRPRPNHLNHVELLNVAIEEILADTTHLDQNQQLTRVHVHNSIASTAGQSDSAEAIEVPSNASDKISSSASRSGRLLTAHTLLVSRDTDKIVNSASPQVQRVEANTDPRSLE
jgi:hypothetical protein